jgi:hypothetical protein
MITQLRLDTLIKQNLKEDWKDWAFDWLKAACTAEGVKEIERKYFFECYEIFMLLLDNHTSSKR